VSAGLIDTSAASLTAGSSAIGGDAPSVRFGSQSGAALHPAPSHLLGWLQFCLAGRVEIFGVGPSENSQNVNQVARSAADCLCSSALQALAKSVSEFQEDTFVVRIAELRLGPFPDGTFRFGALQRLLWRRLASRITLGLLLL
jgi:hypothetical protein